MREITTHVVPGGDHSESLPILAADQPGPGGAHHHYIVSGTSIKFQKGPVQEVGLNGLSNEALLAIVIDRLESFQSGPFACDENACALEHAKASLEVLKERTRNRLTRGVEGKSEK